MGLKRKIKKSIENADELEKFLDAFYTDFGDIIWYFDTPLWEQGVLDQDDLMLVREKGLKAVKKQYSHEVYFKEIFVSVSDDRSSLFLTSLAELSRADWKHRINMFLFDFIFDKGYVEFVRVFKGTTACNCRLTLHGAVGVLMDWVFRECLLIRGFNDAGRLANCIVEKDNDLTKAVLDYVWYDLDDSDDDYYIADALPSFEIAAGDILSTKKL